MTNGLSVEIRLDGHLDQYWSAWLDGLALNHESDGTTTLRGTVADQAQLHGLLSKIRDMGANLISLTSADEHGTGDCDLPCDRPRSPPSDPAAGHPPQL